jgi:RNA polymerase I-specific transcription initiation factor RRN3
MYVFHIRCGLVLIAVLQVEIQVEIEELEEAEGEENGQEIFELDPFDVIVGQEGSDSSDDEDDADDNFSDLSSDAGLEDIDRKAPELPMNVEHIRQMVKKLDTILKLMFDHFQRMRSSLSPCFDSPSSPIAQNSSLLPQLPPLPEFEFPLGTQLPPGNQAMLSRSSTPATPTISTVPEITLPSTPSVKPPRSSQDILRQQFHTLLSIFDRTILRTFKSRYTQFLLFWYTSLDPEFADVFQGMLVDRALFQPTNTVETATPVVTRSAAASYLGSFVSRANFVDKEGTRRVVGVLCQWLKAHLDGVDSVLVANGGNMALGNMSASTANVLGAQNTVFYAVAQALFLIFCFRWRDLLEDDESTENDFFSTSVGLGNNLKKGKKWMEELGVVQRVVNSVLNPLKVILRVHLL